MPDVRWKFRERFFNLDAHTVDKISVHHTLFVTWSPSRGYTFGKDTPDTHRSEQIFKQTVTDAWNEITGRHSTVPAWQTWLDGMRSSGFFNLVFTASTDSPHEMPDNPGDLINEHCRIYCRWPLTPDRHCIELEEAAAAATGGPMKYAWWTISEDVFRLDYAFREAGEFCLVIDTPVAPRDAPTQAAQQYPNAIARNLDRLRIDCGWTFAELAERSGIDERQIRRHIREGQTPNPATLRLYAQTFSKHLARMITPSQLTD